MLENGWRSRAINPGAFRFIDTLAGGTGKNLFFWTISCLLSLSSLGLHPIGIVEKIFIDGYQLLSLLAAIQ